MRIAIVPALALLLAAAGPVSAAEVVEREVTEKKTTTYSGTVSSIDSGHSTMMLRSETSTAPSTYTFTEKTTFVDDAGNVVTRESVVNRPVTVYYTKEGDAMIVSKVVVNRPTGGVIQRQERKETTTEYEEK
ncbi:MAG TPA: hypothetical protein VKA21_13710 [Candidatus Binatia bacterium]|nr:hypothetical protein [Candidatus Binatia bacterium]